jgi:exosome complex RNA-binding protein Csl4
MGDDTIATQDKAIAKKYKDYVMEEDFAGNIEIIKKGEDLAGNKLEDVYMSYTVDDVPLKVKKVLAKVEEYEEFTARPDAEGKMKDVEQGVPDEVVQEGTMFEDNMTLW